MGWLTVAELGGQRGNVRESSKGLRKEFCAAEIPQLVQWWMCLDTVKCASLSHGLTTN